MDKILNKFDKLSKRNRIIITVIYGNIVVLAIGTILYLMPIVALITIALICMLAFSLYQGWLVYKDFLKDNKSISKDLTESEFITMEDYYSNLTTSPEDTEEFKIDRESVDLYNKLQADRRNLLDKLYGGESNDTV